MDTNQHDEQQRTEPPAVRLLPPTSQHEMPNRSPEDDATRRWLPVVAGLAVATLGLLMILTLPDHAEEAAPTSSPPQLMSEFDRTIIDVRKPSAGRFVETWRATEFEEDTVLHDATGMGNGFVLVGADGDGPRAWRSGAGVNWRPATRFSAPSGGSATTPVVTQVLEWDGAALAFGKVGGVATVWRDEEYLGAIDVFASDASVRVLAGKQLLAFVVNPESRQLWRSDNGIDWTALSPSGLSASGALPLGATNRFYYAASLCPGSECPAPKLFRSDDGLAWTTIAGEGGLGGFIIAMASTPERLIAIGSVAAEGGQEPQIWTSPDGSAWMPRAKVAALHARTATLELVRIDPDFPRLATILIDGSDQEIAAGTVIETDGGTVVVTSVDNSGVAMEVDGVPTVLREGTIRTVARTPILTAIDAEGDRVVVAGRLATSIDMRSPGTDLGSSIPAVWLSEDGGGTWEMSILEAPSGYSASSVALARGNVVVTGTGVDGAIVWHGRWSTAAEEAAAVETTLAFFAAFSDADVNGVMAALPAVVDPSDYRFELPSIGGATPGWWDAETGQLDPVVVSDSLDYIKELGTGISVDRCSTTVTVGVAETIRVVCQFAVSSDLLDLLAVGDTRGRLDATFQDGRFASLKLHGAPSLVAWQTLVRWAAEAGPGTPLLGEMDDSGAWIHPPVMNATAAPLHLEVAAQFADTLLLPGATRVTETPFGPMEWSWVEALPVGAIDMRFVTYSDLGFVSAGVSADGQPRLWLSPDGLDWTPLPQPEVEWIWLRAPFRGGVIGSAMAGESAVALFDGTEWTVIPIPDVPLYIDDIAVNGDVAFLIGMRDTGWGSEPEPDFWMLRGDNIVLPVATPWEEEGLQPIGVAALGEGFVVAASGDPARTLSVFYTNDGTAWTAMATNPLDAAVDVSRMQQHGDRMLVFGHLGRVICTHTGLGETCDRATGIWTSTDGIDWTLSDVGSDEPFISVRVGSGPLGLVAIGSSLDHRRIPDPIYLSTTGEEWQRIPGLSLYEPMASWSWHGTPAVSSDTVVIPRISSYELMRGGADITERDSLIIGRILDE